MTVNDFIKRISPEDLNRMMIYRGPDGGWANISIEKEGNNLVIHQDCDRIFSDDK